MKVVLTKFQKKVLALIKKIPPGKVTTYKELAKAVGKRNASRAIGQALKRNSYLFKIPCHRVVQSDGKIGGFILGKRRKKEILKKEGLRVKGEKILNFEDCFYQFSKREVLLSKK